MLELILGRAGSGKTALVMERIRERVLSEIPGSLLIVPEQYSHEAERELCRVCGDSLSLYAEVLSFSRFASRVADSYGGRSGKTLDKGGKLLCMALALDSLGPSLRVFASARRRPELQRSLLDTVEELKTACADPAALRNAALQTGKSFGDKLCDLALVMEGYEAAVLRSGGDPTDPLERLSETLRSRSLGEGKQVYIDGFTDFTGLEKRVIEALLCAGAAVTVCLTVDEKLEGEMFEPSIRTVFALRRMAQELGVSVREETVTSDAREKSPELRFLEGHMFAFSGDKLEGESAAVRLFTAENAAEECALAAATALYLARENGARWHDIAVAVRGYEDYRDELESAFARYGVPLYSSRRANILQKPLPALIFSAFETIQGGWRYDDIMGCLKTGLFGLNTEECDALSGYAYLWSLHGSAWTSGRDWSLHPGGYGQPETEESREALRLLNALRRRVSEPLCHLAERGRQAQSAREQLCALADFFDEIGLAETLEARAKQLQALGMDSLAAEYVQLWDITVDAMEQCDAVLGEQTLTQEEFAGLFRVLLSQYDVGTIPVSLDSVIAGDYDSADDAKLLEALQSFQDQVTSAK